MALCSKGYTAVIVLHDLQFALQYADDVLLLKQGQLLAFGSAQNVMTAENLSHAFEIPFQVFSTSAFPFPLVFPMAHADSNDNRFSIPNTQTLQEIV
jgi:iron complex transport system ATP-binding protein